MLILKINKSLRALNLFKILKYTVLFGGFYYSRKYFD